MQKIKEVLNQSLETSRKMKKLLFLVAAIYIVSYLIGYLMVTINLPFITEFSESILGNVSTSPVFSPIIKAIEDKNLAFAIAYTFLVNFLSGAFATTTLPGVIPLFGAIGSLVVSGFRGFMIGVLFTYAASLGSDVSMGYGWAIVGLGTLVLELGAYVFSAAAGINISLSIIFPNRYKVNNRWVAFKEAWKDAGRIYVIVVILLALGAIWEMSGIFMFTP